MPNIQSAKKKVRRDKKKKSANNAIRKAVKDIVKKGAKNLSQAFAVIDKAAKKGVIHKNTAARLKSRISKLRSRKK